MRQSTALSLFLISNMLTAEVSLVQADKNLKVMIDGALFTEFRNDRHVPCLYPLMSPGGTHFTRQFPFVDGVAGEEADHPHHIGLWFAHGSVNGHDFWHGRKGEKIVTRQIHHGEVSQESGNHSAEFMAELDWMADDEIILTENRTYTIMAVGSDRMVDVSCRLKATGEDIIFGDTKEGAFAIRVTPTMRLYGVVAEGGITNSEGIIGKAAWGQRAKWVAFHGPDSAGMPTVAAILDHPDNLRHPTWWHARDYGLLTANPFGPRSYKDKDLKGSTDYTLKSGETLTLKYRLVLHQGDVASAELDKRWMEFAEKSKPVAALALGDSITAGGKGFPTYRQFLAPELAKHGISFIGPREDVYSAHAGYGGRSSSFLYEKIDEIYGKYPADFVLLHSGHNHFAKNQPVPLILKNTEGIVRAIHRMNPDAVDNKGHSMYYSQSSYRNRGCP